MKGLTTTTTTGPDPAPRCGTQSRPDLSAARKHQANMASLWSKYRISERMFQTLMDAQKGLCHVCGADFGMTHKRACVDHSHYSGQVRGLLCTQCNTRIGWLEDNWPRIIPYLSEFYDR